MDHSQEQRIRKLDGTVVHELSHVLWQKLDGKHDDVNIFKQEFRKKHSLEEGFATYLSHKHFLNEYPNDASLLEIPSKYRKRMGRVNELLETHGKEILFEIPKRWKEFV